MNEYQEAYERLIDKNYHYESIESIYEDLEVLKPLIDKATPKKPIKSWVFQDVEKAKEKSIPNFKTFRCPICNMIVNDKSRITGKQLKLYCSKCGQLLDWSEVE